MLLIQENYWKLKNKGLCSSEFSGMINVFEIKRILFIKRFKVDLRVYDFIFVSKYFYTRIYVYIRDESIRSKFDILDNIANWWKHYYWLLNATIYKIH